jgi:peptidoglycan/xylan/chitin deacetylase (PgdA/CDA1 family)
MIGVLTRGADYSVVSEFFELFKTPWEHYRDDGVYDVLICTDAAIPKVFAKLVLIYGTEQGPFDQKNGITKISSARDSALLYKQDRIPIYGDCVTFEGPGHATFVEERTGGAAAVEIRSETQTFVRLGFNLFGEIRHLLSWCQPPSHAAIPTLELHIALLRDLIVTRAIPLVEIPPIPAGYKFVACLTHDVDHLGIRHHGLDHTTFGFLYRALIGSLVDFCRGRRTARQLVTNWLAALSLPFVYLGLAKDFWGELDAYIELEKGFRSTFFIIPTKGDPGQTTTGRASKMRAAKYDAAETGEQLDRLISAGCEIALHGIDAWRDPAKGRAELEVIRRATGESDVGVRMHWLFFDERSPGTLEQAGFTYDSTLGYNDAVGYRSGTTQAFKPLGLERLLELPMHLMDTALFFPGRMNLSPKQARAASGGLLKNAVRFGGALTINWHDRSIAPERLWDGWYVELLEELKGNEPWFATAAEAVAWFRKRRSATVETITCNDSAIQVKVKMDESRTDLPGLRVRVYYSSPNRNLQQPIDSNFQFTEMTFNRTEELEMRFNQAEAERLNKR